MRNRNIEDMMYLLYEINRNTDLMISILKDMDSIQDKADDLSCNNNHCIEPRCHRSSHIEENDFFYKIKKFLISLND